MQIAARQEIARRNPNSLLDWSLAYRWFNGELMQLIPAMRDIYRDRHPFLVIQKGAQVFCSEFLINTSLWAADTGQGGRGNVLFLQPTQATMNDFSQARFDRAIADSPYLRGRLYPEPPAKQGPASTRLKRLGNGYIYFRGSESRNQLVSVDADLALLDEYDLMSEGVLDLAQKRLASSRLGWTRAVSTPRYPEAGINALFLQSDQNYYYLRCPRCAHEQALSWESNVDTERQAIVCTRSDCRAPLDLWAPGYWKPKAPGNTRIRGYHLNRLYSPLANLEQMTWESQASTPLAQQEFQNSVLGETFVAPNGGLRLDELDRCRENYALEDYQGEPCVMGVDVGVKLHVVIRQSSSPQRVRMPLSSSLTPHKLWFAGEVDFEALDGLIERFHVQSCAIDQQPERHKTAEFAVACRAMVWLVNYNRREPGFDVPRGERVISCHRVDLMDQVVERFRRGEAILPRGARDLGGRVRDGHGEYYREVIAPQRILVHDRNGNMDYHWEERHRDDHYFHAEVYALLAERVRDRYRIYPAW